MKLSRISFLFLLFIAANQVASAQSLPAKVKSYLNKNYSGWKFHSGDPICNSQSVVSGDFDGNKKTDYAVMFTKGRNGYIIAFLANGTNYKAMILERGAGKNSFLTIARKGESYGEFPSRVANMKLKTDAPVSGGCESSEYLFVYSNGRFKQVFTSD